MIMTMAASEPSRKYEFLISSHDFKISQCLGEGAYGVVALAVHRKSGTKCAIKKINAFTTPLVALRTLREIKFLSKFRDHENIINLYAIHHPPSLAGFKEVYLIQEYMNRDLHQILRGLKALHLANVIHRDLKPSNILVNNNCDVKICDLGLSRLDTDEPDKGISNFTEYVATRWYRAPEIMMSASYYSKAVDMWSVGCILAEMIVGEPLFQGNPIIDPGSSSFIRNEKVRKYLWSLPYCAPPDLYNWMLNHPRRLSRFGDVIIDPLAMDLVKQLLVVDPNKRLTVEEALEHPYLDCYHDPSDEPTVKPISPEEFAFDNYKSEMTIERIKSELFTLINEYV